jgi:hypothetical protein
MDWSRLAYELPSTALYLRKERKKERQKKGEDEEEDISSYWLNLKERRRR